MGNQCLRRLATDPLAFSFDSDQGPGSISFVSRFVKQNADACGHKMRIQQAEAVYTSFLKYMQINARYFRTKQKCLCAPPLIDHMWRQAIIYNKRYKALCALLLLDDDGFIDRQSPLQLDAKQAFYRYQIAVDCYLLNYGRPPHPSVWKDFKDQQEYISDFYYFVKLDSSTVQRAKYKAKSAESLQHVVTELALLSPLRGHEGQLRISPNFYARGTGIDEAKLANSKDRFIYLFQEYKFPQQVKLQLQHQYLLSQKEGEELVLEYLKFLFLVSVSKQMCLPSTLIDELWHLHQAHSEQYRRLSCQLFGGWLVHSPIDQIDEAQTRKLFKATLESYSAVFGLPPPAGFWQRPKKLSLIRFSLNSLCFTEEAKNMTVTSFPKHGLFAFGNGQFCYSTYMCEQYIQTVWDEDERYLYGSPRRISWSEGDFSFDIQDTPSKRGSWSRAIQVLQ